MLQRTAVRARGHKARYLLRQQMQRPRQTPMIGPVATQFLRQCLGGVIHGIKVACVAFLTAPVGINAKVEFASNVPAIPAARPPIAACAPPLPPPPKRAAETVLVVRDEMVFAIYIVTLSFQFRSRQTIFWDDVHKSNFSVKTPDIDTAPT